MPSETISLIHPNWPLPPGAGAVITTRVGGRSESPYASANFGDHVGDFLGSVDSNRALLARQVGVDHWHWLDQVHGVDIAEATPQNVHQKIRADAIFTRTRGHACAVLTADCLPVLLCDLAGSQVAAVHAGWRGLAAGVVHSAVTHFASPRSDILAYLGPAIGKQCFEVGQDVRNAFLQYFGTEAEVHFQQIEANQQHYLADLYGLAKLELMRSGITQIYGGDYCTYADEDRFFSYRRDGITGRMASAIWLSTM